MVLNSLKTTFPLALITLFLFLNITSQCVQQTFRLLWGIFWTLQFTFRWEKEIMNWSCDVPVDLFILGVSAIIGGSHREQHDVTSGGLLEGQGDGDASTLASQVRLHTKDYGKWEEQSIRVGMKCNKNFSSLSITSKTCPLCYLDLSFICVFMVWDRLLLPLFPNFNRHKSWQWCLWITQHNQDIVSGKKCFEHHKRNSFSLHCRIVEASAGVF